MVIPPSVAPDLPSPPGEADNQRLATTPPRRAPRRRLLPSRPAAPRLAGWIDVRDRDRRLIAHATRYPGVMPSQAWRWEWPGSVNPKAAWNRLGELVRADLLASVPLRRGEGVYVATESGARLVRDLTGGLSAPRLPGPNSRRWLGQLGHDLTVAEV